MDNSALVEAFRRRAGAGMANQSAQAGGPIQPPQFMSATGIDQLQKSQPGEAELIVKALIQRLRNLPPFKPTNNTGGGTNG